MAEGGAKATDDVVTKIKALYVLDALFDFHATSMEASKEIGETLRETVRGVREVFPDAKMTQLEGNVDPKNPTRVTWYQVCKKSPEELGETAEVAVISDPATASKDGVLRWCAKVFSLDGGKGISATYVGMTENWKTTMLWVELEGPVVCTAHDAALFVLARLRRVSLIVKAGRCAGLDQPGQLVMSFECSYEESECEEMNRRLGPGPHESSREPQERYDRAQT